MSEGTAFAVERFAWTDDGLEVVGRWTGLRRSPRRAELTLVADGARRRIRSSEGGEALEDGRWRARFPWRGAPPTLVEGAELQAGGALVVDLPLPRRRRGMPRAPAEASRPVAPPAGLGASADPEREALLARLHDAEGARELIARDHEALADQLRATRHELSAAQERVAAAGAEAQVRVDAMLADLAGAAEEAEGLRVELAAARAAAAELEHESETRRAELANARAEADAVRGELSASQMELAGAREEAEAAGHDGREATAEHVRALAELRDRVEAAEQERDREREEVARLRTALLTEPTQAGGPPDGDPGESWDEEKAGGEDPTQTLVDRVTDDLARERETTRRLRAELDRARSETAEHQSDAQTRIRALPAPATTAGGRSGPPAQPRPDVHRRAGSARQAAPRGRGERRPSAAAVWTARLAAVVLTVLLGVALWMILGAIT